MDIAVAKNRSWICSAKGKEGACVVDIMPHAADEIHVFRILIDQGSSMEEVACDILIEMQSSGGQPSLFLVFHRLSCPRLRRISSLQMILHGRLFTFVFVFVAMAGGLLHADITGCSTWGDRTSRRQIRRREVRCAAPGCIPTSRVFLHWLIHVGGRRMRSDDG